MKPGAELILAIVLGGGIAVAVVVKRHGAQPVTVAKTEAPAQLAPPPVQEQPPISSLPMRPRVQRPSAPLTPQAAPSAASTPAPTTTVRPRPAGSRAASVAAGSQNPNSNNSNPNPKPRRELINPDARVALSYVGANAAAEQIWESAINDPAVPGNERSDLIEDLNEDGFADPDNVTTEEIPLIVSRLDLIERMAPGAMDDVNAAAFAEAHKDLSKMLERLARK